MFGNYSILFVFFPLLILCFFAWAALAANLARSLFIFLGGLISLSFLIMFLGSEVVGIAHLVIYVGGVLLLLLFGLFLLPRRGDKPFINNEYRTILGPAVVALGFLAISLQAVFDKKEEFDGWKANAPFVQDNPQALGQLLMSEGAPALEMIAILLLISLVGVGYLVSFRLGRPKP